MAVVEAAEVVEVVAMTVLEIVAQDVAQDVQDAQDAHQVAKVVVIPPVIILVEIVAPERVEEHVLLDVHPVVLLDVILIVVDVRIRAQEDVLVHVKIQQ